MLHRSDAPPFTGFFSGLQPGGFSGPGLQPDAVVSVEDQAIRVEPATPAATAQAVGPDRLGNYHLLRQPLCAAFVDAVL